MAMRCKNTSYTSDISMHCFPRDEGLRRLWIQFVMRYRTKFAPSQNSTLCSDHFAPTSFERKLLLEAEADRKPNLLKRRPVPTIDAVEPHWIIH